MWNWIKANKLAALAIVAALLLALGNVLGGPQNLAATKYLSWAKGWYDANQRQKAASDAREREWNARATPVKASLAAARRPSMRPAPTSAIDVAKRFRELGYEGRVR